LLTNVEHRDAPNSPLSKYITDAISKGAPMYNAGLFSDTVKLYSEALDQTISMLEDLIAQCTSNIQLHQDLLKLMLQARSQVPTLNAPEEKSWVMRRAFNELLSQVNGISVDCLIANL
jgi:hypothetical protein